MKKIIKLLKKDTNNLENIIYRKKYIGLTKIFIIYNETLVSSDKVSDFIIRSLDNITPFFVYHKIINNIDNFNKNTILYAHGRIDGTMFGSLKNITKSNWYKKKIGRASCRERV